MSVAENQHNGSRRFRQRAEPNLGDFDQDGMNGPAWSSVETRVLAQGREVVKEEMDPTQTLRKAHGMNPWNPKGCGYDSNSWRPRVSEQNCAQ